MVATSKANIKMIKSMGKGSSFGLMDGCMRVSGSLGSSMEKGFIQIKKGRGGKGFGRWLKG